MCLKTFYIRIFADRQPTVHGQKEDPDIKKISNFP